MFKTLNPVPVEFPCSKTILGGKEVREGTEGGVYIRYKHKNEDERSLLLLR